MTFFRACSLGGLAVLFLTVPASFGLVVLGDRALGDLLLPISKGDAAFISQASKDDGTRRRLFEVHGAVDVSSYSELSAWIKRTTSQYRGLVEAGTEQAGVGPQLAYDLSLSRRAQRKAITNPISYLGVLLLVVGAFGALSGPRPAQVRTEGPPRAET